MNSFERAVAVQPDYAEALNNRGNALFELGRHEDALASYDQALALQPDYADALVNRGQCLVKLGSRDEALASFERALANQIRGMSLRLRSAVISCATASNRRKRSTAMTARLPCWRPTPKPMPIAVSCCVSSSVSTKFSSL